MMLVMATGDPLGTRIAKRRQQLRLSQEQLAELLGVNRTSVANWESGKHYPQRHIGRLEELLGRLDATDGDTYNDPDEAALWALDRFSEDDRRKFIAALREARRERAG